MNIAVSLALAMTVLIGGCDAPVRVGIQEARAAGINVSPAGARAAGPAPGAAAPGGTVFAPAVPQPRGPDDIVGLKLEGSARGQITFGQVFIPGKLPRGSGLAARIGGREVPVQVDVKATNPDGSARMAVLTLAAAPPAEVMLVRAPPLTGAPVALTGIAAQGNVTDDVTVDLNLHGGSPYHFDAASLLQRALADGTASWWLRGPLASEARVDVPVTGSLRLTFDVRRYVDGTTFTDVAFDNDIALQPNGGKLVYDVTISAGGKPVFQQSNIQHYQYQTWHREIWSHGAPDVTVVHDPAYIERTGAVQYYDLTTGVSGSLLAEARKYLGTPGFLDVLGNAEVTKYMGMTGGRYDIGPLTMWNTLWLMTQNGEAARMALAQSDAGGSVPWHFFDKTTGSYLTVTKYPNLWTDPRGRGPRMTGLPVGQDVDIKGTGWSVDGAHQPELNYLPYIMTGSRYRLDQLDAQGTAAILSAWPIPREDGKGLVAHEMTQVRAQAWNLRQIVEAAYIDPDTDPLKPYFTQILANNIDHLQQEARAAGEGEAYGWVKGVYGNDDGAMAPWQQDYLATTIILAARQDVPGAKSLLEWQTHFLAGRFLAGDKGFPPYDAVTYNLYTSGPEGNLQTWREVEAVTAEHKQSGGGSGWPPTFVPYIQAADAVLSGIITVTGSQDAIRALAWLKAHGPEKAPPYRLLTDPTWNIVVGPAE